MAIATYSDLKTKAASWLRRSGNPTYVAEVPDFVTLAEARLNRELGAIETDATLTGTTSSRSIDVSSLSIVQPIALFLAETDRDEIEVQQQADGNFPYLTSSGRPTIWALDGTSIDFNRPLASDYPFRFRYRERFALSDSATTNWLLTNHPDVYLAAVLMWGAGYLESWTNGATFKAMLDEGIGSVKHTIAQRKRGTLRVDPALGRRHRMSQAEWANDA